MFKKTRYSICNAELRNVHFMKHSYLADITQNSVPEHAGIMGLLMKWH